MKLIKNLLHPVVEMLPYALVFLVSFQFPMDPDLGWHLKHGEYFFLNHRILDVNILSSDMANFHYINHSWLFDTLTYPIFNSWGFIGLALVSSFMIVLTFYFISRITQINLWQKLILFSLFVWLEIANIKFSYSSQNLSVLFIVILFYLLSKLNREKNKAILAIIFLLVALWTNMHGQFASGLVLILLFTLTHFLQKFLNKEPLWEKNDSYIVLAVPLSFLATLINPYGIRIYELVFKHLFSPILSANIYEWQSPLHFSYLTLILSILIIISLSSIFVLIYKKILVKNLFLVSAAILFIIPAFSANRYLWIAIFMSFPLIASGVKEIKLNEALAQKFGIILVLILYIFFGFVSFPYKSFIYPDWKTYCIFNQCSDQGAKAIIEHKLNNNLFTTYELGSWLIWNYPQIKPFLDGRMSVWEEERNGKTYSPLQHSTDIEYAVVEMEKTDFKNVFTIKSAPLYDEMESLTKQNKWKKVFEDFNTAVYTKIQ